MPRCGSGSTHGEIIVVISIFACKEERICRRVCALNRGCGVKWEVLLAETS